MIYGQCLKVKKQESFKKFFYKSFCYYIIIYNSGVKWLRLGYGFKKLHVGLGYPVKLSGSKLTGNDTQLLAA